MQYRIIGGPEKGELSVSLFYGTDGTGRNTITFQLTAMPDGSPEAESGASIEKMLVLNGAKREDGSGNEWLIHCYEAIGGNAVYMKAFYDTSRRQGILETSV